MNREIGRWFIVLPPQGAARSVGNEVASAFRHTVGIDAVKTFDCATYLQAFSNMQKSADETMSVDLLNQSLAVQCLDFQATHALVLALSPVTVFSLRLLRKYGIVTVHWFYEDFRAAAYWKDVVAAYNFFLAIQKGPLVDSCAKAGTMFALLPTAASAASLPAGASGRTLDVAFVGIPSAYRIRALETLASRGFRLGIAGLGWDRYRGQLSPFIVKGQWIDADESMLLLSRSAIGINVSVNDPQSDRDNTHISPRVFDIMRAGCALVTEEAPLAREILADCRFHTFANPEEAAAVIADILKDPSAEAPNIRHNRETVQKKHLMRHRVETIISLACPGGADGR